MRRQVLKKSAQCIEQSREEYVLYHDEKGYWKGKPPYVCPEDVDFLKHVNNCWTKDLSEVKTHRSVASIKSHLKRWFSRWYCGEEVWKEIESAGDVYVIKLISVPHKVTEKVLIPDFIND